MELTHSSWRHSMGEYKTHQGQPGTPHASPRQCHLPPHAYEQQGPCLRRPLCELDANSIQSSLAPSNSRTFIPALAEVAPLTNSSGAFFFLHPLLLCLTFILAGNHVFSTSSDSPWVTPKVKAGHKSASAKALPEIVEFDVPDCSLKMPHPAFHDHISQHIINKDLSVECCG